MRRRPHNARPRCRTVTNNGPSVDGAAIQRDDLDRADVDTAVAAFRLLGDPTRMRMMQALCQTELDVTSLTEAVGATRHRVSENLGFLRRAGLVERRRDGKHRVYRASDPGVCQVLAEALRYANRVNSTHPPRA